MEERFLRPRGAVQPPARRRIPYPRWIVLGLVRLALIVVVAAALSVGIALLIGWLAGSRPSRSIPVGLYLGGAALMVVPLGGMGLGRGNVYRVGHDEGASAWQTMRGMQTASGAYVIVGLLLVALGALVDWLL